MRTLHCMIALVAATSLLASAPPIVDPACAADGAGPGLAAPSAANAAAKCQRAITEAGVGFVKAKLQSMAACSSGILGCIQSKPGDASCLAAAQATCEHSLSVTIPALEAKFSDTIAKSCAALTQADL